MTAAATADEMARGKRPNGSGGARQNRGGRWQARYRADGERLSAPHTFPTKAAALAWLDAATIPAMWQSGQPWPVALADAHAGLTRDRYSPATLHRVTTCVRRFANDSGCADPWAVTPAAVNGWLAALAVSGASVNANRSALRTFYRWAVRAGRMESDPTETTSRRARPTEPPPAWREPMAAYRRWMAASGASHATRELRRQYLTALARTCPNAGPWTLDAGALVDWIARHSWTHETAYAARSSLKSFYRWAYETGRTDTDPAEHLPPIRRGDPARRPATEQAITRTLAVADPRTRLMLCLAAELGLRVSEIATIRRRDLADERAEPDEPPAWWLTVKGKGSKIRTIPVPDTLATTMLARWDSHGEAWLFPGHSAGHLTPAWVGKLCSKVLPDGTTAHMLRHRFATTCYAQTRDLFATQRLLGHTSPTTTQRYVHGTDQDLRAAVNAARITP